MVRTGPLAQSARQPCHCEVAQMEKVAERARSIIRTQLGMRETEASGLIVAIGELVQLAATP